MDGEVCGITLTGPGGRRAHSYKLGEWFTPCQWNVHDCHMCAGPSKRGSAEGQSGVEMDVEQGRPPSLGRA